MKEVVVGVLALQGDVREHMSHLEAVGLTARRVRLPADLAGLAGVVIPGGESTTIDKLARAFGLFAPLRAELRRGLPALGTCAGMVLLAEEIIGGISGQQTFGGLDIVVRRNAFGRQVHSAEEKLWAPALDADPERGQPALPATFIRAPWVEHVGERVEVLARVGGDGELGTETGRIVAVRQGSILATAFHPEVVPDLRVHAAFAQMVLGAQN